MIFIIKGFRTIVFIFIVISTTFWPICLPTFFKCLLSKFLRRSLINFIIKDFRTIVFIFIIISTTFRPICAPVFFRCLLSKFLRRNLMIFIIKGFRTIVFIFMVMANGIRTDDPRGFNKGRSSKFREGSRVRQTPEEGRRTYRPKFYEITIKMKTIVRKPLMIIIMFCYLIVS